MASLLTAVKSKMFIFAHRKARGLLDGEYASVFKGRSLDFQDLRNYVPGDEVRDIDWRATARSGTPLVKRYIAARKQRVLFVVDTGRNMAAVAHGGESKKQLAVMAMGVMGSLAINHGDSVSLVHGNASGSYLAQEASTEGTLEGLLRIVNDVPSTTGPVSQLLTQLEYTATHIRRRHLLVVIADQIAYSEALDAVVRRLSAQHEILWIQIEDAVLAGEAVIDHEQVLDVNGVGLLLSILEGKPQIVADYHQAEEERTEGVANMLRRRGIAMASVKHSEEVVGSMFRLLERHRRAGSK